MTYLSAKNSKRMVIAKRYSNSSPFSSNPQINLGKKLLGIPYSSLIMQIYFILNGRRRSLIFFFFLFCRQPLLQTSSLTFLIWCVQKRLKCCHGDDRRRMTVCDRHQFLCTSSVVALWLTLIFSGYVD